MRSLFIILGVALLSPTLFAQAELKEKEFLYTYVDRHHSIAESTKIFRCYL
ncbi:MAG: hypothetical protein U0T83_08455 [Bacteriovoracaceae bacterium]